MSMIDANTCALLGPFFVGASLAYESLFVGVSLASVDIGLPLLLFLLCSLYKFVSLASATTCTSVQLESCAGVPGEFLV